MFYQKRAKKGTVAQKPADIDVEQLRKLAILNPTVEEIAAYFSVSKPTVIKYLRRKDYITALEEGRSNRKTSLKRMQWQAAQKGSVPILIWLGKNELGQREPAPQTGGVKVEILPFPDD